MASAVDTQHLQSKLFVRSYDHDPGATTAIIASPDGGTTLYYVDMALFQNFLAQARPTVGDGFTKLEIVAATDAAFTTPVVVKDSGTVAADALTDVVTEECTAEELKALGANLRYVAARLTCATNTNECNVTYVATGGRFSYENLTPDSVIA